MIPRRAVLERLSLLLGGSLSPQIAASLMGQALNEGASVAVTPEQTALLAEVADVILPTTDTPGAKAAGVEAFIVRVLRDCHPLAEQESFYAGLAKIDEAGRQAHGKPFAELAPDLRTALVRATAERDKAFFRRLREMLETAGLKNVRVVDGESYPGTAIHEMGTARMGRDPKTSVLNGNNQVHAARNVFVTDGACMTSASCVNPSLTYMALTARAADFAVAEMKKGNL